MAADLIPLIVITGPTASGKTAVALELAGKHGGEIICADSRTVYRGLDIGTAKPTAEERARVPHHLLDVVEPNRPYDLARFQCEARAAIADIRSRGKVPFLVGGSGLYIDSVVLDYELGPVPDKDRRRKLEAMSLEELLYHSTRHNIELLDNYHNKRYMVRAIEQAGINTRRQREPDENTRVVAIATEDDKLKERIVRRAVSMFEGDVLLETRRAVETYGEAVAPLQAPAYRAARLLLHSVITKNEAADMLARADWQLVRKQRTWLRRNPWTVWKTLDEAGSYVDSLLVRGGAASSQAEHERATIRES